VWRAPKYPGEFPTLGWLIGSWIEAHCVIPDGDHLGDPYLLTDEMWRFLAHYYRVQPNAQAVKWQSAWTNRRAQLVRPQKWGKGPFSAAMICAEAVGPVRFAGWAQAGDYAYCDCGCGWEYLYEEGDPLGRAWATPWIQVTATSEDQTDNVYRALIPMIEEGHLASLIPDTGETRINLPGGGLIEPVTSSGRARLGQRITFAVQDETHCWVESNGGWKLAETQRRNLAGTGGRALETTNGWDDSEQSVAQRTAESKSRDLHRDHVKPPKPSLTNKRERRKALKLVYGDSHWVDLDRIDGEVLELAQTDPSQAYRYFFNLIVAKGGSWLERKAWDARAVTRTVPAGTPIVLGIDGSDTDDWTAFRAETLDGHQFTPVYGPDKRPCIWNPADFDGQVPRLEVAAALEELMRVYTVVRVYVDPPYWETECDTWVDLYGETVIIRWYTRRPVQMHAAAERVVVDVTKADTTFTHDGCETAGQHVANAVRKPRPGDRYILGKATPKQKIDVAMSGILAHEAACDSVAAGLARAKKKRYAYTSSS
jgi:hypothetical protein